MTTRENLFLNTYQLPRRIQDKIEETTRDIILGDRDRYFMPDCAYGESAKEMGLPMNPYWSCTIYRKGKKAIDIFKRYDLGFFNRYIRLDTHPIIRAHVTLHEPNPDRFGIPHNYHIDQRFPHIVALYYINDADGDTIFCDEHDHSKIIHRETPKRGKCVIFEGLHAYHASSSPTKNLRMTLNINYEKEGLYDHL
tara:strand:- start:169 stop:753 length:585 start_codon:yes stop_codon:yes gene_type:complete